MSSKLRLAAGTALATKSAVLLARLCTRVSTELWQAPVEVAGQVLDDIFEALENDAPDSQASAVALLASCIGHGMTVVPNADMRDCIKQTLPSDSDLSMVHVVAVLATAEPLFTQDAQAFQGACDADPLAALAAAFQAVADNDLDVASAYSHVDMQELVPDMAYRGDPASAATAAAQPSLQADTFRVGLPEPGTRAALLVRALARATNMLLAPGWPSRHGAARLWAQVSWAPLGVPWLHLLLRNVCLVLALDRVGDYSAGEVQAPVRDAAVLALRAGLSAAPTPAREHACRELLCLQSSTFWHARHSCALALPVLCTAAEHDAALLGSVHRSILALASDAHECVRSAALAAYAQALRQRPGSALATAASGLLASATLGAELRADMAPVLRAYVAVLETAKPADQRELLAPALAVLLAARAAPDEATRQAARQLAAACLQGHAHDPAAQCICVIHLLLSVCTDRMTADLADWMLLVLRSLPARLHEAPCSGIAEALHAIALTQLNDVVLAPCCVGRMPAEWALLGVHASAIERQEDDDGLADLDDAIDDELLIAAPGTGQPPELGPAQPGELRSVPGVLRAKLDRAALAPAPAALSGERVLLLAALCHTLGMSGVAVAAMAGPGPDGCSTLPGAMLGAALRALADTTSDDLQLRVAGTDHTRHVLSALRGALPQVEDEVDVDAWQAACAVSIACMQRACELAPTSASLAQSSREVPPPARALPLHRFPCCRRAWQDAVTLVDTLCFTAAGPEPGMMTQLLRQAIPATAASVDTAGLHFPVLLEASLDQLGQVIVASVPTMLAVACADQDTLQECELQQENCASALAHATAVVQGNCAGLSALVSGAVPDKLAPMLALLLIPAGIELRALPSLLTAAAAWALPQVPAEILCQLWQASQAVPTWEDWLAQAMDTLDDPPAHVLYALHASTLLACRCPRAHAAHWAMVQAALPLLKSNNAQRVGAVSAMVQAAERMPPEHEHDVVWTMLHGRAGLMELARRGAGASDASCLPSALRLYQRAGVAWLQWLADSRLGGILADDMGVGKTVQCLATLELLARARLQAGDGAAFLVVCPASVQHQWLAELHRWLPATRIAAQQWEPSRTPSSDTGHTAQLCVVSYGRFRANSSAFRARQWTVAVFDEGHCLRNMKSALHAAACSVPATTKLILSGTPVQNSPLDLHALFEVVMPGYFGPPQQYAAQFLGPIRAAQRANAPAAAMVTAAAALDQLRQRAAPFILRRTKAQVCTELPRKTFTDILYHLTPAQRAVYSQIAGGAPASASGASRAGYSGSPGLPLAHFAATQALLTDPSLLTEPAYSALGFDDVQTLHACWQAGSPKRAVLMDILRGMGWTAQHPAAGDEEDDSAAEDSTGISGVHELGAIDEGIEPAAPLQRPAGVKRKRGRPAPASPRQPTAVSGVALAFVTSRYHERQSLQQLPDARAVADALDGHGGPRATPSGSAATAPAPEQPSDIPRRLVIFSQYARTVDLIVSQWLRPALLDVRVEALTGSLPAARRGALLDSLAADAGDWILCATTGAGGVGINLSAASTAVFVDHAWNPAVDAQAVDRLHRLGQQYPVVIYRLLAQDTIESAVMHAAAFKAAVADMAITADAAGAPER